ncbi:MAG: uroporphyrinogen-III C-methyltransferase [Candidatus Binatia bacterium]
MSAGRVYLIGAGPGDPGLLTLRGRECIAEADVVIHDYLVDRRLLRFAKPGAEIVPSGKRGDSSERDRQQHAINSRMIAEARAGRTVARLKGGDPFVFGRGGEEAEAIVAAGLSFEVVPGVSSAIAVPAYAGIPLTHRGLDSSFTVVTGHEAPGAEPPDWAALARMETLVILMGLRTLRRVLDELRAAGKSADTPAACIRAGTRPDQRVVVGVVGDLADRVERAGLEPPAVIVVGEVVRLRDHLLWYERRPLLGRRILVTRAAERAGDFIERLERLGAEVIAAPTIELHEPASLEAFARALDGIETFDWVVFTSAAGVDVFVERLLARHGDIRALGRARLAAIGPATARALECRGLRVDVVPAEFHAEGLAAALRPLVGGGRVRLPRAAGARDVLPTELSRAGAEVADTATYVARPPSRLPDSALEALAEGTIDAVTFTSSSTVTHLVSLLGGAAEARLGRARIACIGPITARTARQAGLRVDIEAREHTTAGLADALVDYFTTGR